MIYYDNKKPIQAYSSQCYGFHKHKNLMPISDELIPISAFLMGYYNKETSLKPLRWMMYLQLCHSGYDRLTGNQLLVPVFVFAPSVHRPKYDKRLKPLIEKGYTNFTISDLTMLDDDFGFSGFEPDYADIKRTRWKRTEQNLLELYPDCTTDKT